jgi:3-(3-hydroxy-phenyl)propionate hydroxylase
MSNNTDVAIIGAGPVGTLLAILLGKEGKKVTLVERWPTTYDRPRAVTMDHEVARMLATLGIDCNNDPAFEFHEELYYWKNAELEPLELVDWKSVSRSGWRVTYWFNQPELEVRLLAIAADIPTVTIKRGWEAIAIKEESNGVTVSIQPTAELNGANTEVQKINALYAVGCDGANSFVREEIGVKNIDKGYFFDWLILDMVPTNDYTCSPNQWQLCDPKRPTTIVPGGPGRRRWEFMVLPEESSEEIAQPESAWKLLEPWGLTPENAELERSAVYRFQARWAEHWRVGRTVIAGDAAHLMPPFAGAGMCSGMRDSMNLAWRLNGILDGKFEEEILDSYVSERLHHAKHFVDFSQQLGDIICISDPEEAAERDRSMKAALAARDFQPIKVDVVPLGQGVWCESSKAAGELSVQGIVRTSDKEDRFDQVIGQGWMVIGYNKNPADALSNEQRSIFEKIGGRLVVIGPDDSNCSDCDAVDVNGTYAEWMQSIDRHYFILRPDFYVAATAKTSDDLQTCFDEIIDKLKLIESQHEQE